MNDNKKMGDFESREDVENFLRRLIANLPDEQKPSNDEVVRLQRSMENIESELEKLIKRHELLQNKVLLFENNKFVTRQEVMDLVKEIMLEYEAGRSDNRRQEIREEMGSAIREYFSWKRVSIFIVGVVGFIETTLRILEALGFFSTGA